MFYRVKVSGFGFWKAFEGQPGQYNFLTNCFVDAESAEAAAQEALRRVAARPGLAEQLGDSNSAASLVVTESVEWFEPVRGSDEQGLVWYRPE